MRGIVKDTIFNGGYGQIVDEREYKNRRIYYTKFRNRLLEEFNEHEFRETALREEGINSIFIRDFLGYKLHDVKLEHVEGKRGRSDFSIIKGDNHLMLGDMKGPESYRFDSGNDGVIGQILRYRNKGFDEGRYYKYYVIFNFIGIRFYLPDLYHYIHFDLMRLHYNNKNFEGVEDVIDEEGLRVLYWLASRDEIDIEDEDRTDFNRDVVKPHIDFLNKEVIEDEVSEEVENKEVFEEIDGKVVEDGKSVEDDEYVEVSYKGEKFRYLKVLESVETVYGNEGPLRYKTLSRYGHLYKKPIFIKDEEFFEPGYDEEKTEEFIRWYQINGNRMMEMNRKSLLKKWPDMESDEWKSKFPNCPFKKKFKTRWRDSLQGWRSKRGAYEIAKKYKLI